jgi:Mg2+ and Co2+ transporter CorA
MATSNVPINRLADAIVGAMTEYVDDVCAAIEEKVDETADQVLREIQDTSPEWTGEYKKGWYKVKADEIGKTKRIVWNKTRYMLVHLIEFGFNTVKGNRYPGKPHIQKAYRKYGAALPDHIKRILKRGGD